VKAPEIAGNVFVYRGDAFDACAGRTGVKRGFDASDGIRLAFDERLDASVEQIRHPAGDPFARRRVVYEPAKTHALHTSADDKSARHLHTCLAGAAAQVEILSDAIGEL
jgi:hypothetical protein